MTISIINLNCVDLTNIVAFFNVELDCGEGNRITLYGLKLVKSKKNDDLFLGYPQRKADDERYFNHYHCSPAVAESILTKATQKYEDTK